MNESLEMSLYGCAALERDIGARAEAAGGEISDEDLALLVQAQTTSMTKLEGLCGYMQYLESGIARCSDEQNRIAAMRDRAERRLASIKRFLTPYVQEQRAQLGRPLTVGTYVLSTRKSTVVQVDEAAFFGSGQPPADLVSRREVVTPNKPAIKAQLEEGRTIPGCNLKENVSLQLK